MNEIVSFELGKILKEKGFNESVNKYYTNIYDKPVQVCSVNQHNWNTKFHSLVSAPTIADVIMWIYKEKDIWIEVRRSYLLNQFVAVTKNPRVELSSKDKPGEAYEEAIKYCLENSLE
jgi:hypothetical protein